MESAILTKGNFALSYIQIEPSRERDLYLLLNEKLDDIRLHHEINEPFIERFLGVLEDSGNSNQSCYWLLMARIFELALFCAGHYADNCEFSAAGDLLVNPRKVLIHRKGYPNPFTKHRHGLISDQLNNGEKHREDVLLLLKHEVAVEITIPAILAYLFEQMQQSRKIASWYLNNAQKRMKNIADTIGFLSAWSVSRVEDLHMRLQRISLEMRRFVAANMCRFDMRVFEQIGREVHKLIENSDATCKFLTDEQTHY